MEGYKELCLGSDPQNYSTLPKKKCQRTNHFFRASHFGGLLLLAVGADTITYSTINQPGQRNSDYRYLTTKKF